MASATLPLASFENGAVTVSLTYDDQTLAVASVEWQNASAQPAPVTVTVKNRQHTFTLAAGQSGSQDVSKLGCVLQQTTSGDLALGFDAAITWGAA